MVDWRRDDRELLARILAAEAGNQGPVGMTATGNVIMNRANSPGYGEGVRGVIMKPGQFSPMNSVTGYAGGEQGQNIDAISPSETAYMVADSLLSGTAGDITGGATHFYNPKISNPSWARGVDFTRIGDHLFGRADAPRGKPRAANTTQRSKPMPQQTMPPQQPPQQQPRGILEMFGVQKMDPEAQGETALPFYQRPTFSNLMGDLAVGFNSMRLRPDEGLAQRIGGRRQQREQQAQTNRSIEYLSQQPGSEPFIEYINAGMSVPAALQAYQQSRMAPKPTAGISVEGRIVNPVTGEVIYEPDTTGKPTFDVKQVESARKEFTGLPQVKSFADQTSAYGRVIKSAEDPSPAGDLALIFNYMKVLDPGSVVREGEFATAQNAGSIDERTRGIYNRIVSGERLSESQRADFADRATRLYSGAEDQYRSIAGQYADFATAAGLPPEQIIPDFGFAGDLYKKPLALTPPPAPAGTTPEDWATAWENMSDEQRQLFMSGGQ